MAFYELRQYKVRPGKMDEWVKIMEEEIIPFQVSKGMVICGSFRGETDDSVYVWIRRFESEAQREVLYKAVYDSDHWKTKLQPLAADCLDRSAMVVTRIVPTARSDAVALLPARHLVKAEAWQPRSQSVAVAVADVQQKVCATAAIGKECGVDLVGVEPRHRPAIEPVGAQPQDEIGPLQRRVAQTRLLSEPGVGREPAARVGVRVEPRQQLEQLLVVRDNRGDWRRPHLIVIARRDAG